ncbi:MAG: tetratricopeptide repeat protein [Nitrospinales bacterium]
MTKKKAKQSRTITHQTVLIIAVGAFIVGFISGVGFALFKTNSTLPATSNSNPSIDYDKMEKDFLAEVLNNPENTEAWIQLGHVYFDTKIYDKAITAYEKSLELKPGNADVLTDLGIMYRRNGQPQKAIEKFDEAIAVNPKHEMSRLNKGIVLMHDLGDREGAIESWEELLEINPVAMAGKDQSVDQLVTHYKEGHDKSN